MKLNRTTPCSLIEIRMPRWKQRVVGVASFKVKDHNAIDITATGKDGSRYYPFPMYASGGLIKQQDTQTLPSGVLLYLVPIDKLVVLERI